MSWCALNEEWWSLRIGSWMAYPRLDQLHNEVLEDEMAIPRF